METITREAEVSYLAAVRGNPSDPLYNCNSCNMEPCKTCIGGGGPVIGENSLAGVVQRAAPSIDVSAEDFSNCYNCGSSMPMDYSMN